MSSNENNLDNSIESALNMSQDEIEKLLNGYAEETNDNQFGFEEEDLASLLSELEAADDEDIQEISDLLDKADNNEAADAEIEELMRIQEAEGDITAYEAADLFSNNDVEAPKKKGFIQRLVEKFKKPAAEKEVVDAGITDENNDNKLEEVIEQPTEEVSEEKPKKKIKEKKVKEKKVKEKKVKEKNAKSKKKDQQNEHSEEGKQDWDDIDVFQASEDALNGSDAIIFELEKNEQEKQEELEAVKPKKEKKSKNKKGSKKADTKSEDGEEEETKKSKKKEKKPKEKKIKEKKVKIKTVDIEDLEDSEPVSKKKVISIFFICIMLMSALVAIIVNYSGHANRKLAEEAYESGDYLECYQMLYGQHMDESQEVMFHKSEIMLKMDLFWNRYESHEQEKNWLEGLNKLIQFVFEYPELHEYATTWNCENVVEATYTNVLNELYEEYRLQEQDALNIANLESDIDYTRELVDIVGKKELGILKYPNMLPEEEDRVKEQTQ